MSQNKPSAGLATEAVAWIGRVILLAILAIAPWPYGMANWSAQVWLFPWVIGAFACAMFVAVRNRIRVGNPLLFAIVTIAAIGLIQTMSLPEPLYQALSTAADFESDVAELAAQFSSDANTTAPSNLPLSDPPRTGNTTISVHPLQTTATTSMIALAGCVLVSSVVLFRSLASVTSLLGVLALVGFAEAWLGLYQAIVAGDWKMLPELRISSFATFISRNSAPQYFASALGATVAAAALYRSTVLKAGDDKRYQISYPSVNPIARVRRRVEEFVGDIDLFSATILLVMFSVLAGILVANSRGGILSCVAAGTVLLVAYSFGKHASAAGSFALVLLIVMAGVFLSLFELDDVIGTRLSTISAEAHRLSNVRFELWQMALGQRCTWLLGSGLGAFHFSILPAYDAPSATWFYHAENIYIELLSGAGPIGFLAGVVSVGWLLKRLLTRSEASPLGQALRLAALYTVVAIGLQSLADFSLILPGVFLPAIALVGAYLGCSGMSKPKSENRKRGRSRHRKAHSDSSAQGQTPGKTASKHSPSEHGSLEHGSSKHGPTKRGSSKHSGRLRNPGRPASGRVLGLAAALLLLIPCAWGFSSARQFAEAERVAQLLSENDDTDRAVRVSTSSQDVESQFPETALHHGRLLQNSTEASVFANSRWPDEVTDKMRGSMAKPEFFSVAMRSPSDEALQTLAAVLPPGVEQVSMDSAAAMQLALEGCSLDWRASWGLLRGDVGQLSDVQRNLNYARLILGCRNRLPVMEAAATNALMSGHAAGLPLLAAVLRGSPSMQSRVIVMLDQHITLEQLLSVFPDDPFMRITLAQRLERKKRPADDVTEILATVDVQGAFASENRPNQWLQLAWAAEKKADVDMHIDALREASLDAPTRDSLNFQLAKLLLGADRKAEALVEIQRALQFQPRNAAYKKLRDEIQGKSPVRLFSQ